MPGAHRSTLLLKMTKMKWLTMVILVVWFPLRNINVCAAASIPDPDTPADSHHSGSEPPFSESGQSVLSQQETAVDHMDVSASSSGAEAGPGIRVSNSMNDVDAANRAGGDMDSLSRTDAFSGENMLQVSTTDVKNMFGETEKGEVSRLTRKTGDNTAQTSSGGPPTLSLQPAGPARGSDDIGNKKNKRSSSTVPQDFSSPSEADSSQKAHSTAVITMTKHNATASEHSETSLFATTASVHTLSSVDDGAMLPDDKDQTQRTTSTHTTLPLLSTKTSAAIEASESKGTTDRSGMEMSVVAENTASQPTVSKQGGFSISGKDLMSTLILSAKMVSSPSSTNIDRNTFSEHFTTADILTTQVEVSRTVKSDPTFKVTSDLVSMSRTRRQTYQQTTADFSSTVPSNSNTTAADTTSKLEPTVTSASTEPANETVLTTATVTTSPNTAVPQTNPTAIVGMRCQTNWNCSRVAHSQCAGDICTCESGYHRNERNDSCIQEPYGLNVTANHSQRCVDMTWSGDGDRHVIEVTSSGSSDVKINFETTENYERRCNFTAGTNLTVTVTLSVGGHPASAWIVITPSQPDAGWAERNKTHPSRCVDLQWTPGPGYQDNFVVNGPPAVGNHSVTSSSTTLCNGLLPGSRYEFSIRANSSHSFSTPLLVEACTDPERVQNFREQHVDVTWITLEWNPSNASAGDLADTLYVITGNYSHDPLNVMGNRNTFRVNKLSPGTTYYFNIVATFCNRTSPSSDTLYVMTNFSELTPVNVTAFGSDLQVSWQFIQSSVMPVDLRVYQNGAVIYQKEVLTSPHTVSTNRSGACFTVSLQVVNSSKVQTIQVSTEPDAPEKVQNLFAHRLANERQAVNVTWSRPAVTNGIIEYYNVSVKGLRGSRHVQQTKGENYIDLDCNDSKTTQKMQQYEQSTTSYSMVVKNLSEYENYNVSVTAVTSAGGGPSSSFLVVGQLLDTVRDMGVVKRNSSCLSLNWSYPANAPDHPQTSVHFLVDYEAEQTTNHSSQVSQVNQLNITETRVTLCELQSWTSYKVNVTAADREGAGQTTSLSGKTDEGVPDAVSNVLVYAASSIRDERRMDVTWSPPVRPNGDIIRYFVIVRDENTSEVIETREKPSVPRQQRTADGNNMFKETFRLKGDHLYTISVFAATRIGNGSSVEKSLHMPAGVLPESRDKVKVDSHDVGVTSLVVHLPTSLLCNFDYGLPQHAGYIVHHPGWTSAGIEQGVSNGSTPVLTAPWAPALTAFYVNLDVRTLCRTATTGSITLRLGEDDCKPSSQGGERGGRGRGGGSSQTAPSGCSGPLKPNTKYQLLVVFCTSAACRYTQTATAFITQPSSDESDGGVTGLAAGLTVVILLLALGTAAFCWVYKKKYRRSLQPVINMQPVEKERESVCKTRPVPLDMFVDHVQQLHKDSNLGFAEEYKTIKEISPSYPTRAADLAPCKQKNRYMNILPWDRSRVKLIPTDDEEGSDYINANYLPGENHQREFIAAQGPLPNTLDDFWRMVWENRVCVIVMLTQCIEKGKTKCDKYWPDEGVQTIYGDLMIQVRSQSVLPDYIIRVIDVKLGNQSRMIKHFHFMQWPDHGCPERTSMLLNFVSSVRAHMPHSGAGPTLVHCSAGVGRTGTFIALDRLLLQIRSKSQVDIFNLVLSMRDQRMQMVQTENQYIYIHDCLADALTKDKDSDDDQSEEEEEHIYGNC